MFLTFGIKQPEERRLWTWRQLREEVCEQPGWSRSDWADGKYWPVFESVLEMHIAGSKADVDACNQGWAILQVSLERF